MNDAQSTPLRRAARRPAQPARDEPLREIATEDLLGMTGKIVIRHGPERYLLRLTRQNRLLLTK